MSFYIEYNPELNRKYPNRFPQRKKIKVAKYIVFCILLLGGFCIFKEQILDIIIPGDNVVTTSAISSLVDNIKSGDSVYDSFLTFCEEIIVNAS